MTPRLQEWIHQLELGRGARMLQGLVAFMALVGIAALYDRMEFRNLHHAEAMDAAQVARNLSRGEGFTTQFIRPLSVSLLEEHGAGPDLLKRPHPDLANAPVYPLVLAAAMRVLPFPDDVPTDRPVLSCKQDVWVALVNQVLFIGVIGLVYRLSRLWFDVAVARVATLAVAGTELFWRYSVSGLSTMLLMLLVLALAGCLAAMDRAAREATRGRGWLVAMAALVGLLTGLAAMTRYAMASLLLPVLLFLVAYFPGRRLVLPGVAVLAFALLTAPWLWRNHHLSGTCLGTAGFAAYEGTAPFPGNRLQRSFHPELSRVTVHDVADKLHARLPSLLASDLPRTAGNWIAAFFLAGLMLGFLNPTLSRARMFLLLSMGVLIPVQGILVGLSPPSGTEALPTSANDLLVTLGPLVIIFGAATFQVLLDQVDWVTGAVRPLLVGAFLVIVSGPLWLSLLPPRPDPRVAPYVPSLVRFFGECCAEEELMMSDIPWAVAWYGDRTCLWNTLWTVEKNGREDFFAVNDSRKPVRAVYLSPATLNGRFFEDVYRPESVGISWERFAADALYQTNLPPGFPLRRAHGGYAQRGHLLIADRDRWNRP